MYCGSWLQWTLAGTNPENPERGQSLHQSRMILLCLGRSFVCYSPLLRIFKKLNYSKSCLMSRYKDKCLWQKDKRMYKKTKQTRTVSVRCGMSWLRGAVGSLLWRLQCAAAFFQLVLLSADGLIKQVVLKLVKMDAQWTRIPGLGTSLTSQQVSLCLDQNNAFTLLSWTFSY